MGVLKPKIESHIKLVDAVKDFISGKGGLPDFGQGRFEHQAYKYALVVDALYDKIDQIIDSGKKEAGQSGFPVACSAGCSYCCSQPVQMIFPEVFLIGEYLNSNTDVKARFMKKYPEWRKKVDPAAYELSMQALRMQHRMPADNEMDSIISLFYKGNRPMPCPFLEKDMCDIYPARPMNCRQLMASGNPEDCNKKVLSNIVRFHSLDDFVNVKMSPAMHAISLNLGLDAIAMLDSAVTAREYVVNGQKYVEFYVRNASLAAQKPL